MNTKITKKNICISLFPKQVTFHELDIGNTQLLCVSNGMIYRRMKSTYWKQVENRRNHNKGYNVILIEKKQYTRAKIMLMSQGKINIDMKNMNIYHKNGDRLDCAFTNLCLNVPTI